MRWPELDFDKKIWTVPAARMKAGREHRVPLSPRAVVILRGEIVADLVAALRSAKSEHQREVTNRMISEVDRRIDVLVARLFNVDKTISVAGAEVAESDA
jgi:integrase